MYVTMILQFWSFNSIYKYSDAQIWNFKADVRNNNEQMVMANAESDS